MKINYVVIPLMTLIVALSGSYLTSNGMDWYDTLNLPSFTPSGNFIGLMWTTIFILATISALIFYNKFPRNKTFDLIVILFLINAVLNVFWSYLFFYKHLILFSIIEMVILLISVIWLIVLLWKKIRISSYLLFLYAIWVMVATFLAYGIYVLNK